MFSFSLTLFLTPSTSPWPQTILLCFFPSPALQSPVPGGLHWPSRTSGFSMFLFPWKLCFLAIRSQLCYFSSLSCATSTSPVLITAATESTSPILLSWTAAVPVPVFFSCLPSPSCCILCCPALARPWNRARHVTRLGAFWPNGGKNNFEFNNRLLSIEKLHLLLKPFWFSFVFLGSKRNSIVVFHQLEVGNWEDKAPHLVNLS